MDAERPFGISGHLRVKNEAGTLRPCVESVIGQLDELIITYQASEDETEAIVQELAAAYPKKIKAYFYAPHVFPCGSTECEDFQNIHNFANYTNYGYVKISYKYYMKIDSDQIYFSEKLRELREFLLRRDWQFSRKKSKGILGIIKHKIARCPMKWNWPICMQIPLLHWLRHPVSLVQGGVQVSLRNKNLCMSTKQNGPTIPFNGTVGDTIVWVPTGAEKYKWVVGKYYEFLSHGPLYLILTGAFWVHFGPLKRGIYFDDHREDEIIPLAELPYLTKKQLRKRSPRIKNLTSVYRQAFENYWNKDRKYINEKVLALCEAAANYFRKKKKDKRE